MTKTITDLQLFGADENLHGTEGYVNARTATDTPYGDGGLSPEMKTYYSDYLIDNAEPALVHDMFAQKVNIPAGNGKTIQFRKYNPLGKLTTPMAEGVTPTGQTMSASTINATVSQYGGYVEFTDMLLMTSIDNNLCMATKLLGSQAGRTLDTITREVLVGGTNVQYGEGSVSARHMLQGGNASGTNHYLTVEAIRRAVRFLKKQNAEKINGSYIAIIHPDCVYDLTKDENWRFPHQYAAPEEIFEGEIGKIEGVRFIESTEAKVFTTPDLTASGKTLTVAETNAGLNNSVKVNENIDQSLVGKSILKDNVKCYVGSVSGKTMTLYRDRECTIPTNIAVISGDIMYSGEAGANGRDVYATLIFGDNAFGTTSLENGGLEHIVKQLGSAGSSDPLNQRASVGWKASKVSVRLVEAFMVRIETTASAEN